MSEKSKVTVSTFNSILPQGQEEMRSHNVGGVAAQCLRAKPRHRDRDYSHDPFVRYHRDRFELAIALAVASF